MRLTSTWRRSSGSMSRRTQPRFSSRLIRLVMAPEVTWHSRAELTGARPVVRSTTQGEEHFDLPVLVDAAVGEVGADGSFQVLRGAAQAHGDRLGRDVELGILFLPERDHPVDVVLWLFSGHGQTVLLSTFRDLTNVSRSNILTLKYIPGDPRS